MLAVALCVALFFPVAHEKDNGKTYQFQEPGWIWIELECHPSPGYFWSLIEKAPIKKYKEKQIPLENDRLPPQVGVPEIQQFRCFVNKSGIIALAYSGPHKDEKPKKRFWIRVQLK